MEDYGIEFDRIQNAVEDLGMDPTGEDPIDDAIQRAYQQGTLIRFPPGEYTVSESAVIDGNLSRFGIQGIGDNHGDVVFHFPNAENSYWFVHQNGGKDVLLDNFTIDSHEKYVGVRCRTQGGSLIQDVEWRGFLPEKTTQLGQLLDPGCLSVDGVNTVRRVIIGRDGAHVSGHYTITGVHSMTGIRFYGTGTRSGAMGHVGETILEDVEIHQIGSNGVRHTHGDGVVTVRNGLFKNCHLSSLRIHNGNHPSKDSSVTGATVVIDHENAGPIGTGEWSKHGSNGIMLDSTGHGYSQPTYENCDIVCRSILSDGGWGLIRVTNTGRSNPGGAVFKNCRIINETKLQTVRVDPRKPDASPPQGITFNGVGIYLSGDSQPQGAIVSISDDWDDSLITKSVIYASDGAVDGVRVRNCENVTIEDTTISTPGQLITGDVAQVVTEGISSEAPEDLPF
ncbi:hypothetical protein [Halorubrum kocurii]|uniref:Pectate lyase superfamily protein domain-containing protein n=1 Tax=Halorubrum kocurii JCM 14978 TaxID=1230456 RepID=M0NJM4_9EURY|nr:hypothetical protein [Halorubrum kocurii]EMA57758.1 hypothetical protein C468_16510 [Halorubrum kocurii JCM 14978]